MKHLPFQYRLRNSIILFSAFSFFTLISCSQARQDSGQTQQVPVLPSTQEQTAPVANEPVQPVEPITAQQPLKEPNNPVVMLNPPHGEPYHRCDIAVGAPLNSSPANTPRQTTNNPVQAAAPQTSGSAQSIANNPTAPTVENAMRMNPSQTQNAPPANNGSKPRLNPPHGQPYHRCEIPVGSPLP